MPTTPLRPETSLVPTSSPHRQMPRQNSRPEKAPPFHPNLIRFLGFIITSSIAFASPSARATYQTVPVYFDDSPEAWEILGRAADQIKRDNPAEAIRLYQHLLDQFGNRLVDRDQPINGNTPHSNNRSEPTDDPSVRILTTIRQRVHRTIIADPQILKRYRESNNNQARKLLASHQYETAYTKYFLTTAGYTAGLARAEQRIRQGYFAAALLTLRDLEKHPDASSDHPQHQHWARLLVLAGLYAPDAEAYQRGLNQLDNLPNGTNDRLAIQALFDAHAATPAHLAEIIDTTTPLRNPSLAEVSTKPVWKFLFQSGPRNALEQRSLTPNERNSIRNSADTGQFGNFIPTVSDDLILASDGISLVAIDRFDGQQRWRYPIESGLRASEKMRLRQGGRNFAAQPDLSTVATNGRAVLAVIYKTPADQRALRSSNQLVCLDVNTGELRWSALPADLNPSLAGAYFHGSPILAEGQVILVVRATRQRLASEYLVSFDLQTGSPRWSQYLISSPIPRSTINPPPTKPLLHAGIVYLSSPHGCITAINAETGTTRWSRIQEPLLPARSFATTTASRPFEASAPVWTPAGILVDNDRRDNILLINPANGKLLAVFAHQRLTSTGYLLTDETNTYLVGKRIFKINHADLAALAAEANQSKTPADENKISPLAKSQKTTTFNIVDTWIEVFRPEMGERILGRVAVGDGKLVVPTTAALTLIDIKTRETNRQNWRASAGSPLIIGAEVIVATDEGIDSYMPYTLAEPQLRARLALDTTNPAPAISLARLAGRHRIFPDLLPAVDLAIDIINQDPFNRRNQFAQLQLFSTLLELADEPILAEQPGIGRRTSTQNQPESPRKRNSLAEDLYVRLDLIAFSIPQRLEYLFSFGAFLTRENQPDRAVNAYQEILTTPLLAAGFLETAQRKVRAETEATRRLTLLIRKHGSAVYALQEEAARQAFTRALQTPDFAKLIAIANQYPVAATTIEACLQAGIYSAEQDQIDQAIFAWRLGLSRNPTLNQRGRLLGELLAALELEGRTDAVLHELRATEHQYQSVNIIDADQQESSVSAWRKAFLNRAGPLRRFPRIGPFDEIDAGRVIQGDELLLPLIGRPSPAQAFVRTGKTIKSYGGTDLQTLWQLELDRAETDLLVVDGETAILWGQERRFPLHCELISLVDGTRIWHTNLWGQPQNDPAAPPTRRFDRRQRRIGRIEPTLGANEIIFAITSGDVVCIDRFDGSIRWTRRNILPEITQALSDPFGIVIAGQRDIENLDQSAVLLVLDPQTGKTITQVDLKSSSSVSWLVGDHTGHTVVATGDTVIGYDLQAAKKRWRLEGAAATLGDNPQVAGGVIYVNDADARLQTIDIKTGANAPLTTLNLQKTTATSPRIYAWDGRTLLKTSNGIYIFENDGTRSGELARSGSSDLAISGVAIAEDRTVILETRPDREQRNRRKLELYTIDHTGKRLDKGIQAGTSIPKIDAAQAVDDWIIIDAGNHIIMIHAPAQKQTNSTDNP